MAARLGLPYIEAVQRAQPTEPQKAMENSYQQARNKLIYAMNHVTVVIACDEDNGGTWAGATEALKARNGVVAVWRGPGKGPGNARLLEMGAVSVRSPADVLACVGTEPVPAPEQLSLTD